MRYVVSARGSVVHIAEDEGKLALCGASIFVAVVARDGHRTCQPCEFALEREGPGSAKERLAARLKRTGLHLHLIRFSTGDRWVEVRRKHAGCDTERCFRMTFKSVQGMQS